MRKPVFGLTTAAALLFVVTANAESEPQASSEELVCRRHSNLQPTRLLRRIALAALGRTPLIEEYHQVMEAIDDGASADEAVTPLLDGWFDEPDYQQQMRRYHMDLLWTEVKNQPLAEVQRIFEGGAIGMYRENGNYRGIAAREVRCLDKHQSELQPGYKDGDTVTAWEDKGSYIQEGYANIRPFWDPSSTVRVCAFDAQATPTFEVTDGPYPGTYPCHSYQWRIDLDPETKGVQHTKVCGCGPNLRSCWPRSARHDARKEVTAAMKEQVLRLVDDYTRGQEPYTGLLTTKRVHLNGTLTHYYRHLAPMKRGQADHMNDIPLKDGVEWLDKDAWYTSERTGGHAGLFSLPAYLLRFQTNRGRANRFRIAFMGQHFIASQEETPGCDSESPDVEKKCYCNHCHQTLEPMSMYFASFREAGSSYFGFLDPKITGDECLERFPPNGGICRSSYTSPIIEPDPSDPKKRIRFQLLRPLRFSEDHPNYIDNFNAGPGALLADHALQPLSGKNYSYFAWATTRNLFKFLAGREMVLTPTDPDNDLALLDQLAEDFEANDFNFQQLVKAIVLSGTFRRMP